MISSPSDTIQSSYFLEDQLKKAAIILLIIISHLAFAQSWESTDATIHFMSVKNNRFPVDGTLKAKGTVNNGKLSMKIDLETVNTKLLPRDINIKTFFFNTVVNPSMAIACDIDINELPQQIGESKTIKLTIVVTMFSNAAIKLPCKFIRTSENTMSVQSTKFASVNLSNLGLANGPINALIEACKHKSVSPFVVVSFDSNWELKN